MGADGGISYLEVKDLDQFFTLIDPLFHGFDPSWCKGWREWDEDQDEVPPSSWVGIYGTDVYDEIQGPDDLCAILTEIEDETQNHRGGMWDDSWDEDFTFYDVIEEHLTRPYWNSYQSHLIWVLKQVFDFQNLPDQHDFLSQKIAEWAKKVRSLMVYRNPDHIETWT